MGNSRHDVVHPARKERPSWSEPSGEEPELDPDIFPVAVDGFVDETRRVHLLDDGYCLDGLEVE